MKRIAFGTVCLVAAVSVGYVMYQAEFSEYSGEATKLLVWVRAQVQANPFPVALAVGTFLLTVIYHKAKGRSLRESVEAAATRVVVIPGPVQSAMDENPVVKRARARATRTQLLADQNGIENRQRKLPEELKRAENEVSYSEQALTDAERKLADKRKSHDEASAKLETLRKEKAQSEAELAEIRLELKKLAEVV